MAGSIIYAKKVREDDIEVEYQFWRRGKQVHTLWMIKATGGLQVRKGASHHEATLIANRLDKIQAQKGDPTYWPDHVSHIG